MHIPTFLQQWHKLLGWPMFALSIIISVGSKILDARDAAELGLPYDAWFIIGLCIFFLAVGLLLLQFQKRQNSTKIDKGLKQSTELQWLTHELQSDISRISEGMMARVIRWDFSKLYDREPKFYIYIELINTTLFTFNLNGFRDISGYMSIAGEPCSNKPEVHPYYNIRRDEIAPIHITQRVERETADLIIEAGKNGKEIKFNLKELIFTFENTKEEYKNKTPYLHGGEYTIVPKDGIKIEDKENNQSWLEQVLISDRQELSDRIEVKNRDINWKFGVDSTEPFIEIDVIIINRAIFPISVIGVNGRFWIGSSKCKDEIIMENGISNLARGAWDKVKIRQYISEKTKEKIIDIRNKKNEVEVNLRDCLLIVKSEEPSYELEPISIRINYKRETTILEFKK